MNKFILTLFLTFIVSCSTHQKNPEECFLLFNLNTATFEKIVNQSQCEKRLPAASTFEIPLAIMNFDSKPPIGEQTIEEYLRVFEFGNENQHSPKISAFEQLHFLKNLWRGELKASTQSQLKTIGLLAVQNSESGNNLLGKTVSGFIDDDYEMHFGWWLGYLQTKNEVFVVVANFTHKQKASEKTQTKDGISEMVKRSLREKKLW